MTMKRREFLTTGIALGLVSAAVALTAQEAPRSTAASRPAGGGAVAAVPKKIAKTTPLFKSPGMYPNGLAVMTDAPGGLWIGQQKANPSNAKQYSVPLDDTGLDEAAWLVDWNGKLLKSVTTQARNTSGLRYGNQCVWVGGSGSVRHLPGRYELEPAVAPANAAGIGTERRRLPWSEVAPGKTLDCRAAPRRHIASRSGLVGAWSPHPCRIGGQASAA